MKNELRFWCISQCLGVIALVLGVVSAVMPFFKCFGLTSFFLGVFSILIGTIGLFQAKKMNASTIIPKIGLISGIISISFVIIWMLAIAGIYAIM